jgi:hypothetical protein
MLKNEEKTIPTEIKEFNFNKLPLRTSNFENQDYKIETSHIYPYKENTYLDEFRFYEKYFGYIPNSINEININCEKANRWFAEYFETEIKDWYYCRRCFRKTGKAGFGSVFYLLDTDLVVNFDNRNRVVHFLFRKTDIATVEALIEEVKKFKIRKQKDIPELMLLVKTTRGIDIKSMKITKPKLSIEDNYNPDFQEVHKIIIKRLSQKKDKGLVLLHGKPGTGKTSYIRYLIASLRKNVIFLPPNMASVITNPDLISILIDNPNSILVIEDAENIVIDRESTGSSPVSALLNISDGLLSDCLNVQIICSFNTDISKIDSALMRKGRLIAKYEFKELEIEKAQSLSNKLGFSTLINKPMTISEVYNQQEKEFKETKIHRIIGFNRDIKNVSNN